MANNVGKTVEFSEAILDTLLNRAGAGIAASDLRVALLRSIPTTAEPFSGADLLNAEFTTTAGGLFRSTTLVDFNIFTQTQPLYTKDTGLAAMRAVTTAPIEFPTVPVGESFTIVGYCLVKDVANAAARVASDYLAYEVFPGESNPKRKVVGSNDTIRINAGDFNLLER